MSGSVRLMVLAAACGPLAACMAPAMEAQVPSAQAENSCRAETAQSYLGSTASADVGAQLLRATGARELRWVPPGTMVTMEYKYGRLTVGYDAQMKITSIACS